MYFKAKFIRLLSALYSLLLLDSDPVSNYVLIKGFKNQAPSPENLSYRVSNKHVYSAIQTRPGFGCFYPPRMIQKRLHRLIGALVVRNDFKHVFSLKDSYRIVLNLIKVLNDKVVK